MVFRKGTSGNPNGKRASRPLTDALITRLLWGAEEKPRKGELRTAAHGIVEKLIEKALQGDMRAITEIYDRIEGKAVATTLHAEVKEPPISIAEAAKRIAFAMNQAIDAGETIEGDFIKVLPTPCVDETKDEE